MATQNFFHFLSLIPLLLIIINVPSQSHSYEIKSRNDDVHVSLYYDSLSPNSKDFILNVLKKFTQLDVMSIVDLHLVPYGKAITYPNSTFSCEHGPTECFYNLVTACAIDIWRPLKMSLPYIYCIEDGLFTSKDTNLWRTCARKLGYNDSLQIDYCIQDTSGNWLLKQYGEETKALNPPLTETPWLLVNGQHVIANDNLVSYVCNAYKGSLKFKACQGVKNDNIYYKGRLP